MTYEHEKTKYASVKPRIGTEQWGRRSPDVDCIKCWPSEGWGHRPTRKGKAKFDGSRRVNMGHIKGPCFTCAGTGVEAIPFTEVIGGGDWGSIDVHKWLKTGLHEEDEA